MGDNHSYSPHNDDEASTQERIKRAEARYRALFDSIPIGLYRSTPEGAILDINPRLVQLLGHSDKSSLIESNAANLYVDPQARDLWQSLMKREGVVRGFEAQMRRHDGRLIWVRNTARTVRDVDGKVLYYEGSLEDITERKRMEMVLRESEEKYRTLVDNMQDGVFVIRDDKLVFVNEAFARMIGWTVEEIVGTSFRQHVAPEDLEMVASRYSQRQAGEEVPSEYEFRAVHKDGVTRVFVNMSVGLVTYQGATASMGTVKDITGRNRMEEQLRESEERYRTLYESSRDAIVATDLNGQVVECNQAYADMLGYSPEELRGIRYQDTTPPKWHALDVEVNKQVMTLGYSDEFEKEFIRRDSSVIPVSMRVWKIDDKAGDPIGTWTMIRDITERKGAERALREERDKAQMYLDVAGVMIVAFDTNGRVSLMNRKGCEILGCESEEVVGKNWFDCFLPERVKDDVRRVFAGMMNGEIEHIEYRERSVLTKSGEERTIAWHTNRLTDEAGNIIGVLSSGEDITERKRAEKALEESEIRFRTLFETAPVAIVLTDHGGNFLAMNEWMERISDYSQEELKALKAPAMYAHEEDRKRVLAELYETGKLRDFEVELRRKNGTTYHALLNEDLIELEGKKVNFATIRDITEQKRAEEAIRRSEQRYRTLFRHSPVSIWLEDFTAVAQWLDQLRANGVSDLDTHLDDHPEALLKAISLVRVIDVNDETLEMYEADTREGLLNGLSQLLSEVPPEEFRQELLAIWENKIDGIEFEASAMTLKGNPIHVIVRWRAPVIDGRMDLSRVVVATSDITERKRATETLRAASEISSLYLDLMAHDITNQLQVILGSAAVLQNEIRVPETMRKLDAIIHSVDKCAAVISKVKLTEQLKTVPLEQRRLDEALMGCVRMLSKLNDDVTVETDIQIAGALMLADRFLEELLMNLLKNAVEHNPRENRHVWVRLTEEAGGYDVSIADNGEGIADSRKVQLFDMTRRYGGVGLHLCKHILDKYGGRIEVSDREPGDPHQGLEVTVWLPGIE